MKYAGKRLLILGGSRISCEIISRARKMGIRVGVTDWYPLEKSPAKQMADEAYYESTANIPGIVELVKKQKFDGIITGFTDSVLPYYAEACGVLGFPSYGTKEQFTLFTDKKRTSSCCGSMTSLRSPSLPRIPMVLRRNTIRWSSSPLTEAAPVASAFAARGKSLSGRWILPNHFPQAAKWLSNSTWMRRK